MHDGARLRYLERMARRTSEIEQTKFARRIELRKRHVERLVRQDLDIGDDVVMAEAWH